LREEWKRAVISERESSDVFAADIDGDGAQEILSIEPWHGNELVLYRCDDGNWQRTMLDDRLNRGHALCAVDIDDDGLVEIIAGYNGEGTSLHLYRNVKGGWRRESIDEGGLGVGQLKVVDLDGDGRLDIVAGGLSTGNLKWYRNVQD
jgi:hypothetical protein